MSIVNMRVGGKVKKLQLTESFPLNLQEKTATANGEVVADEGYDGLGKVAVNVPIPEGYIKPTGTKTITSNGTHDVSGYANAEVNVPTSGGGGSGECSGTHIIEVTELPTENIDENAVYHIGSSTETKNFTDMLAISSGSMSSFRSEVPNGVLVYCMTKPTDNLVDGTYYYVEDEDAVYMCQSGTLVDSTSAMGGISYLGVISSASEASTDVDGFYVVITTVKDEHHAYYRLSSEPNLSDIVEVGSDGVMSYREIFENWLGVPVGIHVIPTRTTEGILESGETGYHMYYIKDENACDTYSEGKWSGNAMPISGVYSDISEVPSIVGLYLIGSVGGWAKYLNPSGIIAITKNGNYDVADKASVTVSINGSYVVETIADLPETVLDGDLAIVLRGE